MAIRWERRTGAALYLYDGMTLLGTVVELNAPPFVAGFGEESQEFQEWAPAREWLAAKAAELGAGSGQ